MPVEKHMGLASSGQDYSLIDLNLIFTMHLSLFDTFFMLLTNAEF